MEPVAILIPAGDSKMNSINIINNRCCCKDGAVKNTLAFSSFNVLFS